MKQVVAPNHKCNSLGFRLVLTKNNYLINGYILH